MKNLIACALVMTIGLQGCATSPQPMANSPSVDYASVDQSPGTGDDVDLMPPVPSFNSLEDCERAYGAASCGSGESVYEREGMAAPVGANAWFIPYAFGVMTGVLINHYFAPPAPYVYGVSYRSFTSVTVVNNYKVVNQTTINNYNHAPAAIRSQAFKSGPVQYSLARHAITGPARFASSTRARPTATRIQASTSSSSTARPGSSARNYSNNTTHTTVASHPAPATKTSGSTYHPATVTYAPPARSTTPSSAAPVRNTTPSYTPPVRNTTPSYTPPSKPTASYATPASPHINACASMGKIC